MGTLWANGCLSADERHRPAAQPSATAAVRTASIGLLALWLRNQTLFLRQLKVKGRHKIFHIPLDLSVQTVLRANALIKRRDMYAHIHYFTKETALRALRDTGYEVLDFFYTPGSIDFVSGPGQKILRVPRMLGFAIHKDFAVRFLGGFSLLVLAQ